MTKSIPYLYRRGDIFHFRIAVPNSVRYLVGGREITRTLGTSLRTEAVPLALSLAAQAKLLFGRVCDFLVGWSIPKA